MDLLGGGGGAHPPSPGQGGAGGVLFFMIKPKIIRDKMRFSNLSNNNDDKRTVNNNYNSNTVVKQDFAVVEQVDGRVKSLESNCNVLVDGGGGRCSPKQFFPEKFFK